MLIKKKKNLFFLARSVCSVYLLISKICFLFRIRLRTAVMDYLNQIWVTFLGATENIILAGILAGEMEFLSLHLIHSMEKIRSLYGREMVNV